MTTGVETDTREIESLFILASQEDRDFAKELRAAFVGPQLHRTALTIDEVLLPGDTFGEATSRILERVDAVLAVVSRASIRSSFVSGDLAAANAYALERGRPQVIILNITGDEIELPSDLRQLRIINVDVSDLVYQAAVILDTVKIGRARLQAIEASRAERHERVENLAAQYIEESLGELRRSERAYRLLAYVCYCIAYLTLAISVAMASWRLWSGHTEALGWSQVLYRVASSVIVFGLIFALSRFAFMLGKAFMTEALRNSDRRHAISFGHFFLRAFGRNATWAEIKETFQYWNIDTGSYFSQQSPSDFDPDLFKKMIDLMQVIRGAGK